MRREIQPYRRFRGPHRHRHGDKRALGIFIIVAGLLVFLHQINFLNIAWHSVWPFILITIGLVMGIKRKFHSPAPFILIAVGIYHLIPRFYILGVSSAQLALPAFLILIGLLLVFRRKHSRYVHGPHTEVVTHAEDAVNIDVTFGGKKEIITSKDFKGGNVSVTFAGCELHLAQADTTAEKMHLHVKVSFAGLELIVPSNWEIQNEIESTFGNVEDQRTLLPNTTTDRKILVLSGSCSFGGVEIKSY